MLKDIFSIRIQGANFSSMAELQIFESVKTKVSLLYGRNGSGKSTIARAFRKIKGEIVSTYITTYDTLDSTHKSVNLSEAEQACIYVFDEDFVTDNIRIEGSGLGSIIMLGEQTDLTAQIENTERGLEQTETLLKTKHHTLEEYKNRTNTKSPEFYKDKIRSVLQGDGWAGRERKIKGTRHNSPVNEDTYKKFISFKPEKSRDELIIDFEKKMEELKAAESGTAIINTVVPSVSDDYKHYQTALGNKLIKTKIEKTELSDRDKHLCSLMTDELHKRIDELNDKNTIFCPYCLQDLTPTYKSDLAARIQKILTDEVTKHKDQLKSLMITELTLDLLPFSTLQSYNTCVNLIDTINNAISSNNELLQQKINDLYSPIIDIELSEIDESIKLLEKALNSLEEERKIYNSKASETQHIKDKLSHINNRIAYYDVIDFSRQLDKQTADMNNAQKEYDDALADRDRKNKELENLNSRRKSIDIAIDIINNGLKYIFFAENRITIERDGDFYKLLSNGKPVLPKNISAGERNIIGLCYFFTSIMAGKNKDTAYNDEHLIVIDDPVSSYDFENKVGILSFLKCKLDQILNKNINSRAIVMTHDLTTLFDLEKICKALKADWTRIFPGKALNYNILELKDCTLKKFAPDNRYEYTELIKLIYKYGRGNVGEYDIVIGNIMRQVLEAFLTFEYKKGIVAVSNDETLLCGMCDEHKSYFKNLMYRIVLNSGSHREEQAKSMNIDFLSVISEVEKRRTAKEIISFIYLLNKDHVLAHLGNVSSILDTWCEEIKNRATII